MKNLGTTRKIFGMEILWDREACSISLSQKQHVKEVLFRFRMENAKQHVKEVLFRFGMENAKFVIAFFTNHFKLSAFQSPKQKLIVKK